MKRTLTYCDICHKEVKTGVDKGSFRLVGRNSKETIDVTTLDYKDLCYTCTVKLFFLINKLIKGVKK